MKHYRYTEKHYDYRDALKSYLAENLVKPWRYRVGRSDFALVSGDVTTRFAADWSDDEEAEFRQHFFGNLEGPFEAE